MSACVVSEGWLAPHWPVEYGGTGWSTVQRALSEDEACSVNAPRVAAFGISMLGPVIVKYGTEDQKRFWLSRILDGIDWLSGQEAGAGAGLLDLLAEAVGAMATTLEQTVEHLRTRQQFDRPLATFQFLQHRIATLYAEMEQARSAVVNAAKQSRGSDRMRHGSALSAAKYLAGSVGSLVAKDGIQLHGGMGLTGELPLFHDAKRLVMIDHQLGDSDCHLTRYSDQLTVSRE